MYRFFLILTLILESCYPTFPHVEAAHKVMNAFNKRAKSAGLSLIASGGAMMGDIQKIKLGYEVTLNVNIDEARMLLIRYTEDLINLINNDLEIRPYLHNYPATSQNISFGITFCKTNGEFVDPPFIAYVSLLGEKNRIYYSIYDNQKKRLDTIFDEPYEEALRIYHEMVTKE